MLSFEKVWYTIPNFSNYEISEYGDIRRSVRTDPRSRGWSRKKPGELLAGAKKGKKYPTFILVSDDGKYRTVRPHNVVAKLWIGKKPKGKFTLHKDDDGFNNHYKNLYYGTPKQNDEDKYKNGHGLVGEKHPNSTITDNTVRQIRIQHKEGWTQHEIARYFGISQSTVSGFVRNARRKNVI